MTETLLSLDARIIGSYIHGSVAYGTDTVLSDVDERFVYVIPNKYILSDRFLAHTTAPPDKVYFEVQFFLQQLWKGNYNMLDLLYSPTDCIVIENNTMRKIKDMSSIFVNQKTVANLCSAARNTLVAVDKKPADYERKPKMISEAQRLVWKALIAIEGRVWYTRENSTRAQALIDIKKMSPTDKLLDEIKKDIEKTLSNLDNSEGFRKLPRELYKSDYHSTLLKIREGRI